MAELNPEPDYGETSYRGSGRLEGRVALVTEADSGIGRAVALAFAREGAHLMLSCFGERGETEQTARWVVDAGRRAVISAGDVRQEAYRERLVNDTTAALGRLDILVTNSAFQWAHGPQHNSDPLDMERELRTQNESVFFLSRTVASQMNSGGSIIHTMPIQSAHPTSQLRAYATTQTAIANFTASFARQLGQQGIRVNAVAPGPVWTRRIVAMLPPDSVSTFGRDTLRGRPAQPAELASLYVFLASEESKLISGAVIPIG
jgi:NAD(P)-dependent dehydrogenase (short-subunit alcohol dehydrogenase family)